MEEGNYVMWLIRFLVKDCWKWYLVEEIEISLKCEKLDELVCFIEIRLF